MTTTRTKAERLAVYDEFLGKCAICEEALREGGTWHVVDGLLLCPVCNELKKGRTRDELREYLTLELNKAEALLERYGRLGTQYHGVVFPFEAAPGVSKAVGEIIGREQATELARVLAEESKTDAIARDVGLEPDPEYNRERELEDRELIAAGARALAEGNELADLSPRQARERALEAAAHNIADDLEGV